MRSQKSTVAPITPDQGVGAAAAPRPPTPEEIEALMDAAQPVGKAAAPKSVETAPSAIADKAAANSDIRDVEEPKSAPSVDLFSAQTLIQGAAVLGGLGAAYLLIFAGLPALGAVLALLGFCAAVFIVIAVAPGASSVEKSRWTRSDAGQFSARPFGRSLAGVDLLASLDISHRLIDDDPDPRLITTPEGVVVYGNAAYAALADRMGALGGSLGDADLPPRLDRLFAQGAGDAQKLFALARAAKSLRAAREEIFQKGADVRRRFDVSATPHPPAKAGGEALIGWRIRELPIEDDSADALAAPYAALPSPIFAMDRRGDLLWANAAFYDKTGLDPSAHHSLDALILGDPSAVAEALWAADGREQAAKIRGARAAAGAKAAAAIDVRFRAFRRAGAGAGFVYAAIEVDEPEGPLAPAKISGELSESPFGVAIIEGEIGKDAKIIEANQAFLEPFSGANKGAALEAVFSAPVLADIAAELKKKSGAAPRSIETPAGEGDARTFAVYAKALRRKRGGYGKRRTFLYTIEITEQKRMQEGHVQDQKLKAIGNIAGEVAHDFNNILQVVLHTCEDLLISHPAGDPAYQDLLLIRENAQRAANLTAQLLAYSRKQTLTNKTQSITDLLVDFSRFLDRAVGEKVKIELKNGRALPPVRVDRTQLETALMNLAVNARDAMAPDGGRIAITTELIGADALPETVSGQLSASDHVLITVADTGPGVPQKIIDKIFDPFFTTKEPGKGTGLGLSAVQGVIGQMGGVITVQNAPATADAPGGAVFRIYLPADETPQEAGAGAQATPAVSAPPPAAADCSGAGRILVVEDEPGVRLVVVKTLEKAGYDVAIADDGVDALELLADDADFDLVISDIMMPEIDGPSMVAEARAKHGLNSAVIFMSGYAEAAVRDQLAAIDGAQFIQKPFQKADLGVMVRAAIYGADSEQ